jgi:hypothetical protein
MIAARAPGPKWFHQRQAGGARDSNSDLWSYLENLSSADRALEEKVIELAASYAASRRLVAYSTRLPSRDAIGRLYLVGWKIN